jgi:DNA polymerase-3 subunit epsilon
MSVKIDKTRQIVLDTETTGLDVHQGHRIIEIGCVEMINRRLTKRTFHCYLNPKRSVEQGAIGVHGVSETFLKDKPLFSDIAEEFYEFIKGSELIAHNAPFDIGFLDNEFALMQARFGKIENFCKVLDTLPLARRLHPGQRNSLDALIQRYNITCFKRDLHGALLDAEILAQVYLAMTSGQMSLMGLEDDLVAMPKQVLTGEQASHALRVVFATNAELAAHRMFLELLSKESGRKIDW